MTRQTLLIAAAALAAGWLAGSAMHLGSAPAHATSAGARDEILYYRSPMHPWVTSAQPGQCTVCGMDLVPVYRGDSGVAATDEVLLSPAAVRATGIATAPARQAPVTRTLRFNGRFEEDASTHAIISAPVEGRIDGLGLVHDNKRLVQRQPMANIYSRTLLNLAEEYRQAVSKGDAAGAAEGQRQLEECGLVWEQIKAIPTRQGNDLYFGLLSPRTGVVLKSYVWEGQYVRAGERLFEITDPRRLWFMFPATPQEAALLEVGQNIDIEAEGSPGLPVKGRLAGIGRELDPLTHAVDIRVEVESSPGQLRLGENGRGAIAVQSSRALTIPRSAVLWPGGSPRVYVESRPGVFQPREIQLGRRGDDLWEVLTGLEEGASVVTSGGMLLDGQAQLNRLPLTAAD